MKEPRRVRALRRQCGETQRALKLAREDAGRLRQSMVAVGRALAKASRFEFAIRRVKRALGVVDDALTNMKGGTDNGQEESPTP